jgi:hypothetical protein
MMMLLLLLPRALLVRRAEAKRIRTFYAGTGGAVDSSLSGRHYRWFRGCRPAHPLAALTDLARRAARRHLDRRGYSGRGHGDELSHAGGVQENEPKGGAGRIVVRPVP